MDFDKYRAYYCVEYDVLPVLIRLFEERGRDVRYLTKLTALQQVVQQKYPDFNDHFDWDALRIHTFGREGDDVVVVLYEFPSPFQYYLSQYGAIVVREDKVNYYTLERTYEGDFELGMVKALDTHHKFGRFACSSMEMFLAMVCCMSNISLPLSAFRLKDWHRMIACSYHLLMLRSEIFVYKLFGVV